MISLDGTGNDVRLTGNTLDLLLSLVFLLKLFRACFIWGRIQWICLCWHFGSGITKLSGQQMAETAGVNDIRVPFHIYLTL